MLNSTILDVAIGMIFIYLLLSLMCSAANEMIELMLKKRAIDLERGIRELLDPDTQSGSDGIVKNLYDHALVNNLFGGSYADSRIGSRLRRVFRTKLPSYIPARNFALAVMDLVALPDSRLPGAPAPTPQKKTSSADASSADAKAVDTRPLAPQPASGAAGATVGLRQINVTQFRLDVPATEGSEIPPVVPAVSDAPVVPPAAETSPPAPGAGQNPLTSLRNSIEGNPLLQPVSRRALIMLLDAAGGDVAKARENIENWYNSSMDRVSSWYKRRAQLTIFIVGIFVAIAVNVDTITVAKRLSTDDGLRESLVAASDAYAKANASPSPAPTPDPGVTLPAPPACQEDANSAECARATAIQKACQDENSPKCKYLSNQEQLRTLGLPLGWESPDDPMRKWPGANFFQAGGWWQQLRWHWLGWLLTALAISLGAPFWFDLLNKFIVIRSAVKPHEKSPEEKSKD